MAKRKLLSSDCSIKTRKLNANDFASHASPESRQGFGGSSPECAQFATINRNSRKDVIFLGLSRPVSIGRNPACTYVIDDPVVSGIHCKFHAVQSGTGGVIISCQDVSTNGVIINGYKLRKTSAILMDGDIVQIPSSQCIVHDLSASLLGSFISAFTCVYTVKEPRQKAHIFEPTPPEHRGYKNLRVGKFTVLSHSLGSGSFASVNLAIDTVAHRQVACKTIIARPKEKSEIHKFMKEVNILRGLRHPNINLVLDVETNEKDAWLHIFLELCTGGDLFTYITSHNETENRLCEGEAKYIMYQLLSGLRYLHDRMISHRDIKPENILLYSPGPYPRVQIADFGLARPKAYQETLNVCGTVAYLPPEGILALDQKDLGYVGMPADCWSTGVILYTMLSGMHPFDYGPRDHGACPSSSYDPSQMSLSSQGQIKARIVKGEVVFHSYIWSSIPIAKALVDKLLIRDHLSRETVYGALRSQWITTDLEELEQAYMQRIGSG